MADQDKPKHIVFDLGKWAHERAHKRMQVALDAPESLAELEWVQALPDKLRVYLLEFWKQEEPANVTEELCAYLVAEITFIRFLSDGK